MYVSWNSPPFRIHGIWCLIACTVPLRHGPVCTNFACPCGGCYAPPLGDGLGIVNSVWAIEAHPVELLLDLCFQIWSMVSMYLHFCSYGDVSLILSVLYTYIYCDFFFLFFLQVGKDEIATFSSGSWWNCYWLHQFCETRWTGYLHYSLQFIQFIMMM